jgi:hypothetical protein
MFYPINTLNWITNSYGIYSNNTDLTGQDIGNSIQPTFEDCLALCASNENCTHLSYCYASGQSILQGSCWIKSGPRNQSSAISMLNVQTAILNQSSVLNYIIF